MGRAAGDEARKGSAARARNGAKARRENVCIPLFLMTGSVSLDYQISGEPETGKGKRGRRFGKDPAPGKGGADPRCKAAILTKPPDPMRALADSNIERNIIVGLEVKGMTSFPGQRRV